MAEIEWTEEAKYWLQQISDYIARDNEEGGVAGYVYAVTRQLTFAEWTSVQVISEISW